KEINEINIFVEDKGKEYEYEEILSKVFADEYHIQTIYALGGKPQVLSAFRDCKEHVSSNNNIKNIYLLDGDFDQYLDNIVMESHPHIIYLQSYNIENYFLNEESVVTFMQGKMKMLKNDVRTKIAYSEWLSNTLYNIENIFILYCIIQEKELGIPNVGDSEYKVINMIDGSINMTRYEDLKKQISNCTVNIDLVEQEMKAKIHNINPNVFDLICGKHLICSLYRHLLKITKGFSYDEFRWHLVQNVEVSRLNFIKERVANL
ncbi:TPA_asm: DUF4435 domain-containing protein, partial [Listeria monocytogenes]|nr:DUF4435 domain-containing protein [Listeria monocytogenes]